MNAFKISLKKYLKVDPRTVKATFLGVVYSKQILLFTTNQWYLLKELRLKREAEAKAKAEAEAKAKAEEQLRLMVRAAPAQPCSTSKDNSCQTTSSVIPVVKQPATTSQRSTPVANTSVVPWSSSE